jgi:hypothetical protein
MRRRPTLALVLLAGLAPAAAGQPAEPTLITRPDAFPTLVNPMCSHCRDEAKRRAGELKADDRVLCWVRGYSDGGAIPWRFFLSPYRVISDTYGVFVLDADAGFARGFAPSLDFTFHGWRNGVMVMKHKDGTLFSCLTGLAFDGPRKGERLTPVPTLISDWGFWLERYPQAVAYQMFEKYQPVDVPAAANADSVKSRGPLDKRLPEGTVVLGVAAGKDARAYPLGVLEKAGLVADELDGKPCVVLWHGPTRTAAAYRPVASPPKPGPAPRPVTLVRDDKQPAAPFADQETHSRWDIAGRAVEGELKGWTLEWLDGTQVKWFAWAAEYPKTSIYQGPAAGADAKKADDAAKEIAGTAEFLKAVPKKFASVQEVDVEKHTVKLLIDGENDQKSWPLTPDAEVKVKGWWGRLGQLRPAERVWCWFKLDRAKKPVAVFMLADDLSEQDIHGSGLTVKSVTDDIITLTPPKGKDRQLPAQRARVSKGAKTTEAGLPYPKDRLYVFEDLAKERWVLLTPEGFERVRAKQKAWLRSRWENDGLPGTLGLVHLYSGEADVLLDHEAMRWGRSLTPGDKVELAAEPPIKAVVKQVLPQREKTQVRLVVKSLDLADLATGQRVRLRMKTPPPSVDEGALPPDLDRSRTREERVEWFLASMYCTCGVDGDVCTGHFYTLASCNPNGCGAPKAMRQLLAKKIEQGMTDRQIFEELLAQRGPLLLRPHLLP